MDYDEIKERWERAIGKFILSFGDIELFLLRIYEIKMPHRNYFDDDFKSRFDKIIGVLKDDKKDKSIIDGLIELKNISDIRHLLAHNPLYMDLYQHAETNEFKFEMSVANKTRNGEKITIEQLESACSKVAEISNMLYGAFQSELWCDEG